MHNTPHELQPDFISRTFAPMNLFPSALFVSLLLWSSPVFAETGCADNMVVLPKHGGIVAEGDSLTYGQDTTSTGGQKPINASGFARSSAPFPETLESDLQHAHIVTNHGYSGDRSIDGLERWAGFPTPALTLIMYGTNDFGNFGRRNSGVLSPVEFEKNLISLARRRLDRGGAVVLLTAPPLKDQVADQQLNAYRTITRDVAADLRLKVLDTPELLADIQEKWVDGVHLSPSANTAIAQGISSILCVEN